MPNRYFILALMFVGAACTAATVPFMGLFIVEGLGKPPWMISIFSALQTVQILFVNRYVGRKIDEGGDIRFYLLCSILAFLAGVGSLLLLTSYWTLLTLYAVGLAISGSSVSIMFSFARFYAEQQQIDTIKFNAEVRALSSLAWMIAPACSFAMSGLWGHMIVFKAAFGLGFVWLLIWRLTFSQPFTKAADPGQPNNLTGDHPNHFNAPLWAAAATCLFLSIANALVLSASPLYYIHEVRLPAAAPGLALSVKCLVEVVIILAAPRVMRRFGLRNALLLSALVALVCFIYLSQIQSMPEMFVANALEGAYYGIFAAVGVSFVQSFANGRIGHATSLFSNSLFLGGMIGGALMGVIADLTDYRSAILAASAAAVATIMTLILTRHLAKEAEPLSA